MDDLITVERHELTPQGGSAFIREKILALEKAIEEHQDECSDELNKQYLKHSFAPGMYARQLFLPAGTLLTGRIHKYEHHTFIMYGSAHVFDEFGARLISGPDYFVTPPATKRALYVLTDMLWITVHHNPDELRDPEELINHFMTMDYVDLAKEVQPELDFEGAL